MCSTETEGLYFIFWRNGEVRRTDTRRGVEVHEICMKSICLKILPLHNAYA